MLESFGMKIKNVGKSAQKMTESINISAQIEEKNRELKECFRQLGEIFYKQETGEIPEQYKGIFEKIEYINQSIENLQKLLQQVKGIRPCPQCGEMVESKAHFCMKCGYSMPFVAPIQSNTMQKYCNVCGTMNDSTGIFCINCGSKLDSQNDLAFGIVGNEMQADAYTKGKTCTVCGAVIKDGNLFCVQCGSKIEE